MTAALISYLSWEGGAEVWYCAMAESIEKTHMFNFLSLFMLKDQIQSHKDTPLQNNV